MRFCASLFPPPPVCTGLPRSVSVTCDDSVTVAELLDAVAEEIDARRVRSEHTAQDRIPSSELQLITTLGGVVDLSAMVMAAVTKKDIDIAVDVPAHSCGAVANVRVRHAPLPEAITVRFGRLDQHAVQPKQVLPLEPLRASIPAREIRYGLLDFRADDPSWVCKLDVPNLPACQLWLRDGQRLAPAISTDRRYHVIVATMTGEKMTFEPDPFETGETFRRELFDRMKIPAAMFRLLLQGGRLDGERTLFDSNVRSGSTIHLLGHLRGNGDIVANHLVSTSPVNGADDVMEGIIPITARFDASIGFDKGPGGDVIDGAIEVAYGPRGGVSAAQCRTPVSGTVGYDAASHTLTFIPDEPIPPNSRVRVYISPYGDAQERSWRNGSSLPGTFWFDTRRNTKRLLLHAPASAKRRAVGCEFTVETSSPFRDMIHAVATALEVEPTQLASLHAQVGTRMAPIRTAADVAQLQGDDALVVVLKGEQIDGSELLKFHPHNIDKQEIELLDQVGRSATEELFRARWRNMDVACVVCRPVSKLPDLAHELASLRRLVHPNIARVVGYSQYDDTLTILSEPGALLFDAIHTQTPKPARAEDALRWARQIAQAMCFLHCRDLSHRRLTSRNVILSECNHAKVTNFALTEARQRLLDDAGAVADVAWLAPEVLRGVATDPKAADVYSFGVLLWELLTGKTPWVDVTPANVTRLVGFQGVLLPTHGLDDSSPLVGIMSRCFLEPSQRPSFEAIVGELEGAAVAASTPRVPEEFVCPITHEVMNDPVICADGNTYERTAIERWLQTHDTSPNTNLPLPNKHLIPNIALRATIRKSLLTRLKVQG